MNARLIVLLLCLAHSLCASYVTLDYGEDPLLTAAGGGPTLFLSPPYFTDRKLEVRIRGTARFFSERVMSFDSPVSFYNRYSVFAPEYAGISWNPRPVLGFDLSLEPWKTFDYSAEYRFPPGAAVFDGVKSMRSSGSVDSLRLSALVHVLKFFTFGATAGFLSGKRRTTGSVDYGSATNLDWKSSVKTGFYGWKFDLHAGAEFRRTVRIALQFSFPVALVNRLEDGSEATFEYPLTAGIRAAVLAFKPVPAEFFIEGLYGNFRDFEVVRSGSRTGPFGRHDTVSFLAGMSTVIKTANVQVPFRLGYVWRPDFLDYFADRHTLFAGFDMALGRGFGVSLNAEFTKRNWIGDNIFYEDDKLIDENSLFIRAGLTWGL